MAGGTGEWGLLFQLLSEAVPQIFEDKWDTDTKCW